MRRKDREVTDLGEKLAIIDKCDVCRLAVVDTEGTAVFKTGRPYIVPMNFGYEFITPDDSGIVIEQKGLMDFECEYVFGRLVLYFHTAKAGRLLSVLGKNNAACFEMDTSHRLVENDIACEYSFDYESIIGEGFVEFVEDEDEKKHGLDLIMERVSGKKDFEYSPQALTGTVVFKIDTDAFTAKRICH